MKSKIDLKTKVFYLIVSFIVAVVLWYIGSGSGNDFVIRTFTNVPVDLVNINVLNEKGLILDNDEENFFVNVQFRGTNRNLDNINEASLKAEADLSQIESQGSHSVDVTVSGFEQNVILEEVLPSTIQIQVSSFINSTIVPKILTEGKPGNNLVVVSATTNEEVTLDGSETDLNRVSSVSGVVDVNGITEDSTELVELHAYDKNGELIDNVNCSPQVVQAQIVLGNTKTVSIKAPQVNGEPDSQYEISKITVNPNNITIAGKPDQLKTIDSINTSVVDIPNTNRNSTFTTESALEFPKGITTLSNLTKVNVTVEIEPIENRNYTITDIQPENVAENLDVKSIEPGSVTIQVEGISSELEKNDASKLKGTLDLKNLTQGSHVVPVNIKLNAGRIISMSPSEVNVELITK